MFMVLPHKRNKNIKMGAFVDSQLADQARKIFNVVITKDNSLNGIIRRKIREISC